MANVTIEDNWGVTQKFRFESFCHGPKNCKLYKMANQEQFLIRIIVVLLNDEGWLDEICTENRGLDD